MAMSLRDRIVQSSAALREMHDRMEQLVQEGARASDIDRLQRQINRATAFQNRLTIQLVLEAERRGIRALDTAVDIVIQKGDPIQYIELKATAARRSMRQYVLDVLHLGGVPMAPREVSEMAAAWLSVDLATARFASLRRDEQRAWDANPHVRPEFVVPAISARDFTALPRLVATSVWPLTERLIGTRTLRRNHLKVLLALIALWQRMQRDGAATGSDAVVALIRTYGRSLSAPAQADGAEWTETLHMLAERELGDIEPLDGEERHAAAVGMARLEPKAQLWGREGPYPEE